MSSPADLVTPAASVVLARSRQRIPSLDGLRAVSITLVLIGHVAGVKGVFGQSVFTNDLAATGVGLFFVISGFLITGLLRDEYVNGGTISLRNFYLRRFLRIFPVFYLYVGITVALSALGIVVSSPRDILASATYTTNYFVVRSPVLGHIWSLSVEEQFYLLWPGVIAFAGIVRARRVAIGAIILCGCLRFLYIWMRWRIHGQFFLVADSIATGCLLAFKDDWLKRQSSFLRLVGLPYFPLLITLLIGLLKIYHGGRLMAISASLTNFCLALLVFRFVNFPSGVIADALNWKPVSLIGVWSYSLYLWHVLFINRDLHGPMTDFPLNLLCSIAAAVISYYVVELPFLRLKNTIASREKKGTVRP